MLISGEIDILALKRDSHHEGFVEKLGQRIVFHLGLAQSGVRQNNTCRKEIPSESWQREVNAGRDGIDRIGDRELVAAAALLESVYGFTDLKIALQHQQIAIFSSA